MIFDFRKKVAFILISVVITTMIMAYSVYDEIKVTKNYLSEVFAKLSDEIEFIAEDTKNKALEAQKTLQNPDHVFTDETSISALTIHTYPDRGVEEYGFNQGVYQDEAAVGSLYGLGPISKTLDKHSFLALDRIWSGYKSSLLPALPFVVGYRQQYVYLASLTKFGTKDKPVFPGKITPERYRDKLGDTYKQSLEKYGYFFTKPFTTFIGNKWRIFIIVPLTENGEVIADFGNAILAEDILNILNVYSRLDNGIEIYLKYSSGINVKLSDSAYHTWTAYQFDYNLPGDLSITVAYDFYYFINEKIQFFLLICVFFIVLYGYLISIDNRARYQDRLRNQLNVDPMTNLHNRRAIDDDIIDKIRARRAKGNTLLSIIAIDADKFKQINDTYGHHVGDQAIIHIADTMKQFIREGDYCIRMGGDEFMLVLLDVTEEEAEKVAERLCEQIKQTSKQAIGVEFTVTCAAIQLKPDEIFDQAYKRVDDGLYVNKKAE